MSGKSPYQQGQQQKIPFLGNDKNYDKMSVDPVVVGSPKTSILVKQQYDYPVTSNYNINKPSSILKTANPGYASGYTHPVQSVYLAPQKASVYVSQYKDYNQTHGHMGSSNYHTSSLKLSTANRDPKDGEDVSKLIKEINDERMKKSRVEYEKQTAEERLKEAHLKINELENNNRRLENHTSELNDELRRVAWRLGGDLARDNRIFTGEELHMLDVNNLFHTKC